MRRTKPVRLGELWDDWLKEAPGIARKLAEAKVSDAWPSVAGHAAACCTASIEVKNGVLHVRLTSSVVRSELFMRRAALADALNRAVGMEVIRTVIIK